MMWTEFDPTVLVTSEDRLPEHAFHGYCFVDADLVIGHAGAQQYRASRGRGIPPGLDGAYVTLSKTSADTWQLGTDYKGFSHLYYYAGPTYWAVSNSYMYLHHHLRDRGIRLEPNLGVIAAFAANINLVRAMMSFDTPTQGITMLPSDSALRLTTGPQPRLEPIVTRIEPDLGDDYEEALTRYLDIWSARFQTIFAAPDLGYRFHVTGGRDSRAVLSIGARSLEVLDPARRDQVHFFSQTNKPDDFRIATMLAEHLRFPLNVPPPPGRLARNLSAAESFRIWENAFCGAYSHLMFPERGCQPSRLTVAGVGGEAHRRTYRPKIADASIEQIAESTIDGFRSPELFAQWRDSLVRADDHLRRQPAAHPLAMVRSHREFRDRFHSGKSTIWATAALPLCSQYLVPCSGLLSAEDFDESQILFDIMSVALPGIATIPYEVHKKEPTARNLERLATFDWSPHASAGEVFNDDTVEAGPVPDCDLPTPLAYLLERVERDLDLDRASEIVDPTVLTDGIDTLRRTVSNTAQNLHGAGRTAHLAYLMATLLD